MSKRGSKAARPAKLAYVGPSTPGVAGRNTVYWELPGGLAQAVRTAPYLAGLCVPLSQLSGALDQLERRQGSIYSLYTRALADSARIQKGVSGHGL